MNCANHPQTVAVAYCRTCGKPLCESCKRDVRGVIYCEDCLAARVGQQSAGASEGQPVLPAAFAPPSQHNYNPGGPNPAIAGILSGFITFGTGAMYCGEFMRALVHAGIWLGLIALLAHNLNGTVEVIAALTTAFWYFFMIFDSVRVAKAKQRGEPVPDIFGFGLASPAEPVVAAVGGPAELERPRSGIPMGAVVLIVLGVLFLFGNVWDWDWIARLWPLILIAVGIRLFLRRNARSNRCPCVRCTARCSIGAAVVTTLGMLLLLDQNFGYRFDFGRTWPLLLIVIGIVAFLRNSGPTEGHIEPPPPPSTPAVHTEASEVQHG